MNCPKCGNRLKRGNKFCNRCGYQTGAHSRKKSGPKSVKRNVNPAVWTVGIIAVLLAVGAVIALVFILPASPGQVVTDDHRGGLHANPGTSVASADIGAKGGSIRVDEGELSGFSIDVFEDSFDEPAAFEISTAPIVSHDYGEVFNAASPLITIDNGGIFAEKSMIVTIPIEKEDDEFALAFFYDEETKELRPMPLLSLTNDKIVTMTQHFSEIVVSKTKKDNIELVYDTKFVPGIHDFQIANNGSYIEQKGFCTGQCVAMAYYYQKDALNQGKTLYGRFDNDGITKTPKFWYDDADAIRLCSCLQHEMGSLWDNPSKIMEYLQDNDGFDNNQTYWALLYGMMLYEQPQIVVISGEANGDQAKHAVLAYKVTKDAIYIADPNYPGDTNRTIEIIRESNGNIKFGKYTSDGVDYEQVGFYGLSALMNEQKTIALWREVIDGSPTNGISAEDYFPEDAVIEVAVDKDDQGNYITKPLIDGFLLSGDAVTKLELSNGNNFMCRIKDAEANAKVWVMMDTGYLGETDGSFNAFQIAGGVNRIGIYYMLDEKYVNFYWYDVIYEKIEPMMTANPAQAKTGEDVVFTIDLESSAYIYKWTFGDGQTGRTEGDASIKHAYSKEGAYTASAGIYNKKGEYLGKAETTVSVTGPEVTTTPEIIQKTEKPTGNPELWGTWQKESGTYYVPDAGVDYYYTSMLVLNSDGTYKYELLEYNAETGEIVFSKKKEGNYSKQKEINGNIYYDMYEGADSKYFDYFSYSSDKNTIVIEYETLKKKN